MMKKTITVVLLLFVAASVGFLVVSEVRNPAVNESGLPPNTSLAKDKADVVQIGVASPIPTARAVAVAYYFHGTMRCPTCLKMERYAKECIEQTFAAEVDAGLVEWRSVDYDEPANEHFVKEYGLSASALVLVAPDGGQGSWQNLNRIWDLVGDEAAFKAYVSDAVAAIARGKP